MILDTSFLIDVLKGDFAAVNLAKKIESEPLRISAISVFELFVKRDEKLVESIDVVAIDRVIEKKAAIIQRNLSKNGEIIDNEDCLIAATSIILGEILITRNARHFQRIKELQFVSY